MSMSRREILKGMAAGSAVAATALASSYTHASTVSHSGLTKQNKNIKKPNLLIIFPDEWRTQSLGFMQQDPSITPNINKFAHQGVVLGQAVSNFPLCTPFRGMLMTGQYPYRTVFRVIVGYAWTIWRQRLWYRAKEKKHYMALKVMNSLLPSFIPLCLMEDNPTAAEVSELIVIP